jgi:hypothetical protein
MKKIKCPWWQMHFEQSKNGLAYKKRTCKFAPKNFKGPFLYNQDKSAAKFCYQLAAWAPDMFWNFNLLKTCKIANNSATVKVREKN